MRRLPMVYESSAPLAGLLEAGSEEGPSPATKHPGAGISLVMGHDRYLRTQQQQQQHRARAIFILFRDIFSLVRQRRLRQRQLPETLRACDVKSRRSEWLSSMPNVGLTAAFAAPRREGLLLSSAAHRALLCHWAGHLRAPILYYGTVFELLSEPWKGPQADSREVRQKRAEAAAQRLAGLDWAASDGGIRRWQQARTWHG